MTGLGSDVKNVTWPCLLSGRSGGEQPVVLGKTSTEETDPATVPVRDPPVIKRTFSSVETPVDLCLNSLSMFCREGNFQED